MGRWIICFAKQSRAYVAIVGIRKTYTEIILVSCENRNAGEIISPKGPERVYGLIPGSFFKIHREKWNFIC